MAAAQVGLFVPKWKTSDVIDQETFYQDCEVSLYHFRLWSYHPDYSGPDFLTHEFMKGQDLAGKFMQDLKDTLTDRMVFYEGNVPCYAHRIIEHLIREQNHGVVELFEEAEITAAEGLDDELTEAYNNLSLAEKCLVYSETFNEGRLVLNEDVLDEVQEKWFTPLPQLEG